MLKLLNCSSSNWGTKSLQSYNPATHEILWEGEETTPSQLEHLIVQAKQGFRSWSMLSVEERYSFLLRFKEIVERKKVLLAELISQETGKPHWESLNEVQSVIQKVAISQEAYQDRCKERNVLLPNQTLQISFKPHGVVAVFGPFNFPLHLPNGHIIPSLLAGNCVLFKPSEKTPRVCLAYVQCFMEAGLPEGVIGVVLGGASIGAALSQHPGIDGLFFTGSMETGIKISQQLASSPQKILALEMGGNNPLLISSFENLDAACYLTILSAFLTSGQRCSAARRLILIRSPWNEHFLNRLITLTKGIKVGSPTDRPEPFMGPLIDIDSANKVLNTYKELVKKGAKILQPMEQFEQSKCFLTPGIIDITGAKSTFDAECFGPLLQVTFTDDLESGIAEANRTRFGLSAGIVTKDPYEWKIFKNHAKAGIVNWNTPLTGASSLAPFGGIGLSGNHRPSAYLAADYCSYPVASLEVERVELPKTVAPGISL